ncbi:MAG: 4Fe-4S dicluster domain-containing protein [bacterium]|nr:4Fe-4S dicluster domain-containing protein [bacterium]
MNAVLRWLKRFVSPPKEERLNLGRRGLLASAMAGVTGGLLFRVSPRAESEKYSPGLIRPPGALAEDEFLARCVRCGECMKVCITNVIQPAQTEAGVEGFWTPALNMNVSYCEHECTLCGQVCPTGAIRQLTLEEKKKIRIGQAFFDRNRCLPWAFERSCIVCEEHCPVSNKAIWFQEIEVTRRDGSKVTVKQPHVDAVLCTGCGICHSVCPIKDEPGVYVTSVGESRHPGNQMLLESGSGLFGGSGEATSDPYGGGGDPYGG